MPTLRRASGALITGIALGAAGRASDYLPPVVEWTASLGVPWLATAFILGALFEHRRTAASLGAVALVTAVATYYGILFVENRTTPAYAAIVGSAWAVAGAAAGAAFGYAGASWRSRRPARNATAVAVLGGALVGEALLLLSLWHAPAARRVLLLELALGAILPLLLARGARARALAVPLTAAVAATALVAEGMVREAARAAGWAGA